jgi:hypothetical protein
MREESCIKLNSDINFNVYKYNNLIKYQPLLSHPASVTTIEYFKNASQMKISTTHQDKARYNTAIFLQKNRVDGVCLSGDQTSIIILFSLKVCDNFDLNLQCFTQYILQCG